MNEFSFKFVIKEFFKLSTGATAFVGLMEPADFPIITGDKYEIEIRSDSDKCYKFKKINEDIFAKSQAFAKNKFRSLQTFENVDEFLGETSNDPITIYGYKKS